MIGMLALHDVNYITVRISRKSGFLQLEANIQLFFLTFNWLGKKHLTSIAAILTKPLTENQNGVCHPKSTRRLVLIKTAKII